MTSLLNTIRVKPTQIHKRAELEVERGSVRNSTHAVITGHENGEAHFGGSVGKVVSFCHNSSNSAHGCGYIYRIKETQEKDPKCTELMAKVSRGEAPNFCMLQGAPEV